MSQFRLEHRQQQTLTPRLQQAVRLLQLSSLDFAQEVQQELDSNPFLEPDDSEMEASAVQPVEVVASVEAVEATPTRTEPELAWDSDNWGHASRIPHRNAGDDGFDLLDLAEAEVSLHDYLHGQLNVLALSERDVMLTALVVEALDDDGYLRVALEELQTLAQQEIEVERDELEFALRLVQSLEPAGVAARDLRECLLLQLGEPGSGQGDALCRLLISDYLDRLARHDVHGLARLLERPVDEVQSACTHIRRLDPHPGWRYGQDMVQYITPDVVVRKLNGQWLALLNPAAVPKVRLNKMYAELFQQHRESHHGDMASYLQEARWTVRNVEQRFATILRVAQAIVDQQTQFFEYGALAMRPMGLKEIADGLDLHESTVSRVTNNKYMATPSGVYELKYFFSRSLHTASGGTCSTEAVRKAIKEMIQAESASAPLSDAEITRLLSREGLQVARRTVTKYRQMMRIPAVDLRRQHL